MTPSHYPQELEGPRLTARADARGIERPRVPATRLRDRRREILLALASMGLVLGLLAGAEALARAGSRTTPNTSIDELHTYSEVYGWELRKGQRFVFDGVKTTINARGYRGPELPPAKGSRTRIVVLGDSVSFGTYVSDDETFSHVLQATRPDLEVANLAVQGYGPDQELIKLEREGLALKPDVVIVGFCLSNDLADASLETFLYNDRHPKPFYRFEAGRLVRYDAHLALSLRSRLALFLTEHSRLYERLFWAPRGGLTPHEHWQHRREKTMMNEGPVLDLAARLWGRMAELSREAGARLVILAFPEDDSFASRSRWLDALAGSDPLEGVPIVDMGERFRAKGFAFETVASDTVGHLSPVGHRVVADVIEDVLEENGIARPERDEAARPAHPPVRAAVRSPTGSAGS